MGFPALVGASLHADDPPPNQPPDPTYSVSIDSPGDGDIFLMDSGETASGTATEVDEEGSSDVSGNIAWSTGDDDMGSGATSNDFTKDSGAITLTATIDDGEPSGDETDSIDVTIYDIVITGPDSTLDGASASFAVNVKDPSDENPDSFKWTYEVPSGAGWLPDGNIFSDDSAESPSVGKAHWFAYPNQNNTSRNSTYTLKVELGFGGKTLSLEKDWTVKITDHNKGWLGHTPRPKIEGMPEIEDYEDDNGNTKYKIEGVGDLSRKTSTNNDIVYHVHAKSQWREKTRVHEEEHVKQWSTGDWSEANGWFTVAELFEDYLDEIDDDYGSRRALILEIEKQMRLYHKFENREADNTSPQREAKAHAAGAKKDPPYLN